MEPKKSGDNNKRLFQSRLDNMIDMEHPLVRLAGRLDWFFLEKKFGEVYIPAKGRPGLPTRLMAGLHYLKGMYSLSDERLLEEFLENPYWQYFCGLEYFEHHLPLDSSSMTRWRKRIGSRGFENLLGETLKAAESIGAFKPSDAIRVNVDTTVQEKNITFPTDAKLLCKGIELLARYCKRHGIELRQSYARLAPKAMRNSYYYARQRKYNKAHRCVRELRTYLGRVLRDIDRKIKELPSDLNDLTVLAYRVYNQRKEDSDKLYSYFCPEVSCISKGKAHKKYEFGSKTSIVSTSKGNWILGASVYHDNPYDGHTLSRSLIQSEQISGYYPKEAYCDKGYKGLKSKEGVRCSVFVSGMKGLGKTAAKFLKRRSAIEPIIGHLKSDHGMERNFLKGAEGDKINALMASCGFNMRKLLRAFLFFILRSLYQSHLRPQTSKILCL